VKIALLAYLATYGNAPLLARALAARGYAVSLIVARRDAYGFWREYPGLLLEDGRPVRQAARAALDAADRLVCLALPGLTAVLPAVVPDRTEARRILERGGLAILSSSHLLRDPGAACRCLAESGLRIAAMNDKLPYLPAGTPVYWPPIALPPEADRPAAGPVRIAHTPGKSSRHGWKGTAGIEAVFPRLRERFGSAIETQIVRGLDHGEMLARRAGADILVDQVLEPVPVAGSYPPYAGGIGKNGLEAAAAGTVVVASGAVPPPLVRTDPDRLFDVLAALIEDPDGRRTLGRVGRAFVAKHCDPAMVAQLVEGLLP